MSLIGDPETSVFTFIASSQLGKSTTVFMALGCAVCEDPGPAMWVMADAEMAKEIVSERLMPFLENIPAVAQRLPKMRNDRKELLVKFTSMNLYVRGSQSKHKLASVPIRWLMLDEVSDYRSGALAKVTKRTRAYRRAKTIIIGSPADVADAQHREWSDGTRSFLYWPCPHCGHQQPFRFGRGESPIYGKDRDKGGFRWDDNERTRVAGKWVYAEVIKNIWYECEGCGGKITEDQKFSLLARCRRVDTNPNPLPRAKSMHAWTAYVSWVRWADIVVEFLKAEDSARAGDIIPMQSFIRETLGEPWRLVGAKADDKAIRARQVAYVRGEKIPTAKSARILTVDVQAEAQIFKYVYRQHVPGERSRLVDYGTLTSFESVRAYQEAAGVKDKAVWIDTGHKTVEVYRACLRYGWIPTKGDQGEGYVIAADGRRTMRPWTMRRADPFLGTDKAGRTTIQLVRFSSNAYKDRLYLFLVRGKGLPWEVWQDIGEDYIAELTADEVVHVAGKRVWVERGTNDWGDCEILQLVAADAAGVTRADKV